MILIGNQRGGGRDLALHLLSPENDHVTVHEVRGFASDNVQGAFQEAYAMSVNRHANFDPTLVGGGLWSALRFWR